MNKYLAVLTNNKTEKVQIKSEMREKSQLILQYKGSRESNMNNYTPTKCTIQKKCLQIHILPRLSHEKIENLSTLITSKEIESVL